MDEKNCLLAVVPMLTLWRRVCCRILAGQTHTEGTFSPAAHRESFSIL